MSDQSSLKAITYGKDVSMTRLREFLNREMEMNRYAFAAGRRRRVPCVWGLPGVGKTDLIKAYKDEGYVVKSVPLAQFEEMGDLNGIPREQQDEATGRWETVVCPPMWVPDLKRDGPKVIVLLDDFNRADPRIVKGTMQLVQDYGLVNWQLDQPDWHMMCTANPEGGLNDVTPLDPAQISRFSHVTLKVEGESGARDWAQWASKNGVDTRAISFILMHPAWLFTGKDRVNPRTWTQAFEILKLIKERGPGQPMTKDEAEMMTLHVGACVEPEAAAVFSVFLTKGIMEMIEPEEILENLPKHWARFEALTGKDGKPARNDCLFAILERLYLYIQDDIYKPDEKDPGKYAVQGVNLCRLITSDLPGGDMRWALARRMYQSGTSLSAKTKMLVKFCKEKEPETAKKLTKMLADAVSV